MSVDRKNSNLVEIASQMLHGRGMPDFDDLPLPSSASRRLRRELSKQERRAHEQCRLWAIELYEIAKSMKGIDWKGNTR
jgi:hypothetical protein